jgi:hypothetical protein
MNSDGKLLANVLHSRLPLGKLAANLLETSLLYDPDEATSPSE